MTKSNNLIYCITIIIVAIIAAITYLASQGHLSEPAVTNLFLLILGAIGVTGTVHITGNVIEQTNGHKKNGSNDGNN